jgi:hypothetical protein
VLHQILRHVRSSEFISAANIVHRLPGRIRIRIPILQKVPSGWLIYSQPATDLIALHKGIEKVKIQPITGCLTICYNPDRIQESDILKWLKTLVQTFLNQDMPSVPLNELGIRLRFARLRDRISRACNAP